jgi:nudix-type nucleoside diphosphatase (YffH/AdpP family)
MLGSRNSVRRVQIEQKARILDDFFKVDEARLRYERFDGRMSPSVRRLNFERGDSVAAVIVNKNTGRLLLVNQFKYPTYEKGPGWITELVAGMIEDGESPEAAARREIEEEMGYRVGQLEPVSTFYVSPGGSSERIVLYYAEVESADKDGEGGGASGENEDIMTVELTLPEALDQIHTGQIVDAKTILGVLWLQTRQARRSGQSGDPFAMGRHPE